MAALTNPPALSLDPAKLAHNAKLAKTVAEATGGRPSILQPKWDGWRGLVYRAEDGVHIYSRKGIDYAGQLPHVEAEFLQLPPGTWIDGEVVAVGVEDGLMVNDWGLAQSVMTTQGYHPRRGDVNFVAFDLIAHANLDARPLPYEKRRTLLETVYAREDYTFSAVTLAPELPATEENHEAMLAQGFEGSIVRVLDVRYGSNRRGHGLFKLKPQETLDAIVMGFKPGENGFTGMVGAIIFGAYKDGELVEMGRASGMDLPERKDMTKYPDRWIGAVVEIAHHGFMDGGYRHPQFKRRRDDKDPLTVEVPDHV